MNVILSISRNCHVTSSYIFIDNKEYFEIKENSIETFYILYPFKLFLIGRMYINLIIDISENENKRFLKLLEDIKK